jgi:transcriptional regulator with XRE-family HTH domain
VAALSCWCYRRPDPNNTRSIAVPVAINRARLQSERRQRGWSQDDLAAASGISARTVQRLERGGKATVSSLAALASALAVSAGELTASIGPVRRITPLTVLADIAPTVDRFRRMGFGAIETEHAGCVGVVAGNSHHLLCSRAFMVGDWPADIVAPLVGHTIPYIWVSSLESASQAWDFVVHRIVTDHGTREALVQAGDGCAILAETVESSKRLHSESRT